MGRVAQTPLAAVGLLTPAPLSAATTAHRLPVVPDARSMKRAASLEAQPAAGAPEYAHSNEHRLVLTDVLGTTIKITLSWLKMPCTAPKCCEGA